MSQELSGLSVMSGPVIDATHVDERVEEGFDAAVGLRLRNTDGAAVMTGFGRKFQDAKPIQGC
ncbi:hypothetical protein [Streptomyces sp. NPDC004376]